MSQLHKVRLVILEYWRSIFETFKTHPSQCYCQVERHEMEMTWWWATQMDTLKTVNSLEPCTMRSLCQSDQLTGVCCLLKSLVGQTLSTLGTNQHFSFVTEHCSGKMNLMVLMFCSRHLDKQMLRIVRLHRLWSQYNILPRPLDWKATLLRTSGGHYSST